MKWYPISLRYTPVRDETGFSGVKLGTKDRVTLRITPIILSTLSYSYGSWGLVLFDSSWPPAPPPLSSPWSTRQWEACWLPAWQATNHIIHHKDCVTVHGSMKSCKFLFCVCVLCCEPICQTGGTSCTLSTALVPQNMSGRQACLGLYLSADRDCTNLVSFMMTTTSSWSRFPAECWAGLWFCSWPSVPVLFILWKPERTISSFSYFKPLKELPIPVISNPSKRELPVLVISKPLKEPPV